MPSPKDGTAGTIVTPTAPKQAQAADTATPGQMEELKQQQHRETKSGSYGSAKIELEKENDDIEGVLGKDDA